MLQKSFETASSEPAQAQSYMYSDGILLRKIIDCERETLFSDTTFYPQLIRVLDLRYEYCVCRTIE